MVVKQLPAYVNSFNVKNYGINGCTLRSDGSSSTPRFTTSMPTPRPENSVTSVLVEKPGASRKLRIGCTEVEDGVLLWLEAGDHSYCLFVDELLGPQQVVGKQLPAASGGRP